MEVFKDYLLQNWAAILVLIAFGILLMITVFLDKKTKIRMAILVVSVFLLSIVVFTEFYLESIRQYNEVRLVMMAIRYSATPLIIALVLYTLVDRAKWYVLIPALLLTVLNIISIFTGIVFSIDATTGDLVRFPVLGYFPYIGVGVYSVVLVVVLIIQSNKQASEIIPIVFLAFSFISGIIFPLVIGKEYSKIFCSTIAIALFVYYVFMIFQLTKKDALTRLLNRQAYYSYIHGSFKEITAFVSIDMNGLKVINDNEGHLAGDKALVTLAHCFSKATRSNQFAYRIGGDEFIIICKKTSEEELRHLVERIKNNVSETQYSCSIGYCYSPDGKKSVDEMIKESDDMMYANKAKYYSKTGKDRRLK